MAKKDKNTPRTRHTDDVISELFGSEEGTAEIEAEVSELGDSEPEEEVKIAHIPSRQKFMSIFAAVTLVFAAIGLFAAVRLAVIGIRDITQRASLRHEFSQFILPAAATDISPFENESELPNSVKINCAVWRVLFSEEFEQYKTDSVDEYYVIPEYNIETACKELFGPESTIVHSSVGYGESRFDYDPTAHTYTCTRTLRNLSYAPQILSINRKNGLYVLKVAYISPSISMITGEFNITDNGSKIMEYVIKRENKRDTLVSVEFTELVK